MVCRRNVRVSGRTFPMTDSRLHAEGPERVTDRHLADAGHRGKRMRNVRGGFVQGVLGQHQIRRREQRRTGSRSPIGRMRRSSNRSRPDRLPRRVCHSVPIVQSYALSADSPRSRFVRKTVSGPTPTRVAHSLSATARRQAIFDMTRDSPARVTFAYRSMSSNDECVN